MPVYISLVAFIAFSVLAPHAWASFPPDSLQSGSGALSLHRTALLQEDEVLWLARCIYSESDRPDEQRLVAWVVRNRVETGYRGATYRDVVLEPMQFSAFNTPTPRRQRILNLDRKSPSPAWQRALQIAEGVYSAPSNERPFSITTRHFYSPISMEGGRTPEWAENVAPVDMDRFGIDPYRFLFFDQVDENIAATVSPGRPMTAMESAGSARRKGSTTGSGRRRLRLSGLVARPARPSVARPQRSR